MSIQLSADEVSRNSDVFNTTSDGAIMKHLKVMIFDKVYMSKNIVILVNPLHSSRYAYCVHNLEQLLNDLFCLLDNKIGDT